MGTFLQRLSKKEIKQVSNSINKDLNGEFKLSIIGGSLVTAYYKNMTYTVVMEVGDLTKEILKDLLAEVIEKLIHETNHDFDRVIKEVKLIYEKYNVLIKTDKWSNGLEMMYFCNVWSNYSTD